MVDYSSDWFEFSEIKKAEFFKISNSNDKCCELDYSTSSSIWSTINIATTEFIKYQFNCDLRLFDNVIENDKKK